MYLLDTNVVSELHKAIRGKGDARVTAWLARMDLSACFLSTITLMELEVGVLRMERRDAAQGGLLRAWLDRRVVPEFAGRLLTVDEAVARRCAQLHVPDPRPERDALIAATALVHGMTVVTHDVSDFASTGVTLFNPWQPWTVQEASGRYVAAG
ncbi:PIN domain-containing protein [Rhodanobacter lindaniclasticus]